MLKPNRGLNKLAIKAGKGKKPRGRRTAVFILVLAACSAAALTACGSGLKFSLAWNENPPAGQKSVTEGGAYSSGTKISSGVSSATVSEPSQPPASSAACQPERIAYEKAKKPLWISVSLNDQTVSVLDAEDRIVSLFSCSTGLPGNDTPEGTFTISDKGKSFYSPDIQEGAYYWTRFKGTFLFHSLPFDSKENMIAAEAEKLGSKASHGCVRLTLENAKWIYENIPKGTKVVIA